MSSAIVFVSNPYLPDPRVKKEIATLKKAGHNIILVARNTEPRLKINEKLENCKIHRITLPIPKKVNYLNGGLYYMRYVWRSYKYAKKKKFNIIHCHDIYTLPIGILLRRKAKKPLIYDCHEHYQDLVVEEIKIPQFIRHLVKKLVQASEFFMCNSAGAIITVDERLKNKFIERYEKVEIVANYPDKGFDIANIEQTSGESKLIYGGGINRQRGIMAMVKGLKIVKEKKPDVKLLVLGEFKDDSRDEVELVLKDNGRGNNVIFKGGVTPEDAMKHYSEANVCLALLQPTQRFKDAVPIKLFEYMLCARPVIISDFPDNRKIVESAKCGFLVDPTNIEDISDKILWLLDNSEKSREMGENGRRAALNRYNWESQSGVLIELYKNILNG